MAADIDFYFDPICPFAWMTSKWVRQVTAQRDYRVDWRFISLRVINANVDYSTHFPPEYAEMHQAGLRLLRVAARTRAEHGRDAVGPLYAAYGAHIFETEPRFGTVTEKLRNDAAGFLAAVLTDAGLPTELAAALEDDAWDAEIASESSEALALTGKDVGTPIIHFRPPNGVAFFGPVISRLPSDEDAGVLWDHVIGLASFPGFAELKRSLREMPRLKALGVSDDETGAEEDWHGGSRRLKK